MTTATIQQTPVNDPLAEFAAVMLKPRYECKTDGVYFIAVETDKNGDTYEKPPLKLSDCIELIGRGIDAQGSHYRIITWRDRVTRQVHTEALPMGDIGNPACWQILQSHGVTVLSGRRKRELLADYLQTDGLQTAYTVTAQAGWTTDRRAYILPSGEVIQAADSKSKGKDKPARVIYNGDKSQAAAYTESGTLAQWQAEIGQYLTGNSRLCLATGAALAAPLLTLLGMEAGGFHLFGDSRDGKTTAAKCALSVWGDPTALLDTWTGTAHGFSNRANARNDGLMVLDEIGQANARHVSQTAYSVINGVAKIQGAKDGGNREAPRWKVLLLSTGEKPLDSFLEQNKADWNAGQAARLPSVPSNAGHGLGVFDTLHGHEKGAHLSETITANTARYHGTLGRAFIRLLLDNQTAIDEARQIQADFMQILPDTDGQARTVAARFALAAAALELAARYGLAGIPTGAAFPAVKQCFDAWHARSGGGKYEDRRIIKQAAAFMQQYAHGQRFTDWNSQIETTDREHAGYKKRGDTQAHDEYWIIPPVFEAEICQSFETAKTCTVLHGIGWLKKPPSNWRFQKYGAGRFFVLIGAEPPNECPDFE